MPAPVPIYLDHAATTPVRREVLDAMEPYHGVRFGNPSSTHRWGREARAALDEARECVARCLGAHPDEVAFTSGGTEADNLAILGMWRAVKGQGRLGIVTTPVEHKAVLAAVHQAAREGADERFAAMRPDGMVDRASFESALGTDTAVCTVMWVNNEIGTIQPIAELAATARARRALFHTDAVQALGKVPIDVSSLPVDVLTVSGHKIGAPKGIGAIFIRRGTPLEPLLFGGSQDKGRRPGTENVAAAIGFARAAELAVAERDAECARLGALRDSLERAIMDRVPGAVIHCRDAPRVSHILNVSVPGTDSASMLMALDLAGVAASSGSACQSGSSSPSHVLSALGVAPDLASAAIRMSLGCLTTPACVERVAQLFPALAAKARGTAVAT